MKKILCSVVFIFIAVFLFAESDKASLKLFKERVTEIKKAYKTAAKVKDKVDDANKILDDFLELVETDDSIRIKVVTITNYVFVTNYVTEEVPAGVDEPADESGDDPESDRPEVRKHKDKKKHGGNRKQEGPEAMSPEQFSEAVASIDKAKFKDEKKSKIRIIAAANSFTVAQIIQLIQKFDWDDERLDVIRQTYPRAVDKNNSFKLYDYIKGELAKSDLTQLIDTYK